MHKLFARQLAKASKDDGQIDLAVLGELVGAAYAELDHDRRRTDRSISLMTEELDDNLRERERTAELLREQTRQLDTAINNMSQGLLLFDKQTRLVICNQRYVQLYHLSPDTVQPGCTLRELLELRKAEGTFQHDPEQYVSKLQAVLAKGESFDLVTELSDGRVISVTNHPMLDGQWVSTHEDITDRHRLLRAQAQAEERLREQKLQLDAALDNMSQGLCMFDPDGRIILFNQRFIEMMGLPADFLTGRSLLELLEHRKAVGDFIGDPQQFYAAVLASVRKGKTTTKIRETADGRALRVVDQPMVSGGWVATFEDMTEQRRLERERDRDRTFLETVINNVPAAIFVRDVRDRRYVLVNRAAEKYYGVPRDKMIGKTVYEVFPKKTADFVIQRDQLALETRREQFLDEHPIELPAVGTRVVSAVRVPILDSMGEPEFLLGVVNDVTERWRAEAAERHNAEVLTATVTSMADAVLVTGEDGQVLLANPAAKKLFGDRPDFGSADWRRTHPPFLPDGTTPFPLHETPISRVRRGELVESIEVVMPHPEDGRLVHLIANGGPLRDTAGTLKGGVLVYRDVTEAKETERQLRQSQKMDAVGQLTGGIAHDFNNILTVITGTIEILGDAVADQPQYAAIAAMIAQAADRGAAMTGQLLAFARKQALQPRETDVNGLIVETTKLLRASLGEHIEIESMLADDAWPALVDPSQLSTALLNLAVNARDAMPNGGKLTLETGNVSFEDDGSERPGDVRPGLYVVIAVTDTGTGIPASVRDKVFEPFFTTKGVGRGTGLGLSMVYGFVNQSGGDVRIYSEEGHGTTIKIYLPRAIGQAQAPTDAQATPCIGGRDTILVVEDDALVRKYVTAQLTSLGYQTLEASNAAEALAIDAGGRTFDLLFTDVIMPGNMNGYELAKELEKRRPSLRALFTSGYTENALLQQGRLPPGVLLLAKPYRKAELARMLRQALEVNRSLTAA